MTSDDPNAVAGSDSHPGGDWPAKGGLAMRRDNAASAGHGAGSSDGIGEKAGTAAPAYWARIERAWWVATIGTMLVFSLFPIANLWLGLSTKDYGLWYRVGLAVRLGLDVYPRPETGRLFPFMYPPSAAAMLGWVSMLGHTGLVVALVVVNSASWLACIALSIWLAVNPGSRRHPLVLIVPSLAVIVLIHNIYLLGQPNLLLLALMLGAFACLRRGRHFAAGAFLATAAAIKAFPIMALGYLVYRRMWTASAATVAVLAGWLLIAPLPFRTPAQALDDVVVWSQGMLFTYNSDGIAQRPIRSYSYKNQSIMALAQRLLRDVPADGESILSRRARQAGSGVRPAKGLLIGDPSVDLLSLLKPHSQHADAGRAQTREAASAMFIAGIAGTGDTSVGAPPRWNETDASTRAALRDAWRVNLVDLDFRTVMVITLASILAICAFVVVVLPPANRRTRQTDAIEYALVILLTVVFSPLSFNYAYVWLIYPTTLALHLALSAAPGSRWRWLKIAWITTVVLIPGLAVPKPLVAQAYGNLFVPALLLVIGLGVILYRQGHREPLQAATSVGRRTHLDQNATPSAVSLAP
jgi:hypothetical protein